MTKIALIALSSVVVLSAFGAAGATGSASVALHPERDNGHGRWYAHVCAKAAGPNAACQAQVVTDANGTPMAGASPPASALGPAQFHGAYNLPTSAPSAQTIAIVDAYDDPNAESDLAVYSTQYGLPPCTTANGCFKKVNQSGGTSYPNANTGWALEIALDIQTAHAICQNCKILLVEATNNSTTNLGIAENRAAAMGADVISNSWGAGESSGELAGDESYFNHPGIPITVSTGDDGYGVQWPASSQYVTAVGGTNLQIGPGNTWAGETAWSGAGSGCSGYETKPAWQTDGGCAKRAVADVSADADPNTGAAVYTTYGGSGWYQVGGTSLASPLIASVYALAGNDSVNYGAAPYANPGALRDITSGHNGSCSGSYLCTAGPGFDGPTGLGSPNGLDAFTAGPPVAGFSLAASPTSRTVTQGSSTTYGVTLAGVNGYSGTAALSIGGLPAGASGAFTPGSVSPVSPSSTLTVNTSGSTPTGTYTVTITGTDGSLVRTTSATLVVQAPPPPPPTLTATPASVGGGGTVTVSWSGVSSPNRSNWIGLYATGAADSAYLGGFYDDSCGSKAGSTAKASGTCSFAMPTSGGAYQFRLFSAKASGLLSTSNTVTVTVVKASPSLSTVASAGIVGQAMHDTATLASGSSPTGTITFRLYGPSDPGCVSTPVATSTATVSGNKNYTSGNYTPNQSGTYRWVATYSGDGNNNGTSGTCGDSSETVLVTNPPPSFTISTTRAKPGASITVTWSGVNPASVNDWIGIFVPGAANSAYLSRIFDSSCTTSPGPTGKSSGSCSVTLPNTRGSYQLRLFAAGDTLLATSATIAVK